MEPQIVARKSQAGMQEVFHRRAGLSPKMRTLLIMLNGTRPIEELEKSLASLGDVRAMLYELNVMGLVEMEELYEQSNVVGLAGRIAGRSAAPASMPASVPAQQYAPQPPAYLPPPAYAQTPMQPQYQPAPPGYAPVPQGYAPAPAAGAMSGMLGQLKAQLSAHMQRVLGEDYQLVRAKIDNCGTIRDFANLLEGCEKVLSNYVSPDAALALKKEFEGVI